MNRQDNQRELTPQEIKMLALVVLASSSYPSMQNKDPQPIVTAWSMMLADIPMEILQAAVVKVCRDSEYFPSVAQIVAAAAELDPSNEKLPTAAEAWEEVERLIIHFGPYRAPVYSCDTVKRAVRAIGCGSFVAAKIRRSTGRISSNCMSRCAAGTRKQEKSNR